MDEDITIINTNTRNERIKKFFNEKSINLTYPIKLIEILNSFSDYKKIDNILDKISKSGYESLSKSEKDFLFKNSDND